LNYGANVTGLPFWRAPRRYVYAVKPEIQTVDSSEDEDDRSGAAEPPRKKLCKEIKSEITSLKRSCSK